MATFRHQWRLFAEQAQGNSSESHQSHTLATFSVTGTSMVMGETSSDFDMLGVLASKIRVWRCVDILFVRFRVCSENIPFFYGFQPFPGSSEHIRAAPPTHTHIYSKAAAQVCPRTPTSHACATHMRHDTRITHAHVLNPCLLQP